MLLDVSDGAPNDVKLASYEALTGLVGTRDVPSIISMYAERKGNNEKLLESKGRGEERLRRLKDERAELEVALKQVKCSSKNELRVFSVAANAKP